MKSINKIKLLNGEIKDIDKVYSLMTFNQWWDKELNKHNLGVIFEGDVFTFKDDKVYVDITFRNNNYVECISRFKLVDGCLNFIKDHIMDDYLRNLGNDDPTEDGVTVYKESEKIVNPDEYFSNLLYVGNIHFDGMEDITKKLIGINNDDVDK